MKFVAAGKLYSPLFYKIHEFIKEKNKEENWQKVLVVTDHIFSGESMRKLVDILEEENIDFDVAAITAYREKHDKKYEHDPCKDPKILQRLYFGSAINENEASASPFYQRPEYASVTKDVGLGLVSAHAEARGEFPEKKKQARKGMRDLAEELYGLVE